MKVHIDTVSSTNWILNLLFDEIATDIINDPRWPHIGSIRTVHKHVLKSKIGIKSTYGVKILTVAQINIFFKSDKNNCSTLFIVFLAKNNLQKIKVVWAYRSQNFLFKESLGYEVNELYILSFDSFWSFNDIIEVKKSVFSVIVNSILPHADFSVF